MPQWTYVEWPNYSSEAHTNDGYIATEAGWVNAVTGELVIAISNLLEKRREVTDEAVDQYLLENGNFLLLETTDIEDYNRPLFYVLNEV